MKATVLLYHDVVPAGQFELSGFQSPDANIYKLSVDEFDRHLAAIEKSASRPITTVDTAGYDSLMITFDDGGKGAILYTASMLEERGWRGHFFMTTDYIGSSAFMSAADLCQLRSRGHVIGSHSCSHPMRMNRCSPAELAREWGDSVGALADILGEPVTAASIPGGYYGENVVRAAALAGIRNLFTSEPVRTVSEIDGCRVLGRFSIQQRTPPQHAAELAAGKAWPVMQERLFWDAKKILKKAGGAAWLETRKRLLAGRT